MIIDVMYHNNKWYNRLCWKKRKYVLKGRKMPEEREKGMGKRDESTLLPVANARPHE
ncbi:MAG: hypothetical protein IJK42_05820 [Prevotella sp.]|nr:hypothetical protein [Prevotella sp.]